MSLLELEQRLVTYRYIAIWILVGVVLLFGTTAAILFSDKEVAAMDEFDTGLGTSKFMWELVSELLDGEKLPDSINEAIYKLREGEAEIVEKKK
jgi:hypothetical protein